MLTAIIIFVATMYVIGCLVATVRPVQYMNWFDNMFEEYTDLPTHGGMAFALFTVSMTAWPKFIYDSRKDHNNAATA